MAKAIYPDDQVALGERFATLREVAGLNQATVGERLGVTKATVSSWEVGRNMPNPFMLRKLAKLYGVSVDALLWDDSLSPEAMKFAAQYDNLSGKQRGIFEAMWLAYFERATSDAEVERSLPTSPDSVPEPAPPKRRQAKA